jgi:hypothetical protein
MLPGGARSDESVGAALRAAIGHLNQGLEITAGDSGSHFPVSFSGEPI